MTASQRRTVIVTVAALGVAFMLVWAATTGPADVVGEPRRAPAGSESVEPPGPDPTESPQAEEDRLVAEVQRTVASGNVARVQDLVAARFAVRYGFALACSIVFLEDLFFHEVHKYGGTFAAVARRLREMHLAHVIVEETGEGDGIGRMLLDHHGERLSAIDRAVGMLAALHDFPPAP